MATKTKLDQIAELKSAEREELKPVVDRFGFRVSDYYLSLIDWNDPKDPIRRLVIPSREELREWGELDASHEADYTVMKGLQHKYPDTALMQVIDRCASQCRYCFRKRLFSSDEREYVSDVDDAVRYIQGHPEITNVLLSGGDPLVMSTERLEGIVSKVREIDHVGIIRIGSKMPAFNPHRILGDPKLGEMLGKYVTNEKSVYLMIHFDHPRELTDTALEAVHSLQMKGVKTFNQTPIIRGINDDYMVITELFNKLSAAGITPYYMFICRPTLGNETYSVPVEEAFSIFDKARSYCSGTAQTARLMMSHSTGKIEIVGMDEDNVYMRRHRVANPQDKGEFMAFPRNPNARWFDDYVSGADVCDKKLPLTEISVNRKQMQIK